MLGERRLLFKELVDLGEIGELVEELPHKFGTGKLLFAGENLHKLYFKLCSLDTRVLIASLEGSQLGWVNIQEEASEELTEVLEPF